MSRQERPEWFDQRGMEAWVNWAAVSVGGSVRLLDQEEQELVAFGRPSGPVARFPLEVNRQGVGWVEVRAPDARSTALLQPAMVCLGGLAEARFSVCDLARSTSDQWREMSVLYRSSELLRGGLGARELVNRLLDHVVRALRVSAAAVRFLVDGQQVVEARGERATGLVEVAEWGVGLVGGVLVSEVGELRHHGFTGRSPAAPFLVVPLRSRERSWGALVAVPAAGRALGAQDLKLASLLAEQAGQAFSNLELVEQVKASERLGRELEVAAEIQRSSLPSPQVDLGWLEVAGACSLAEVVGGDTYLVTPQGDGALAGVADVCGHGLSSAVLSVILAAQLQALGLTRSEPGELLGLANDLLVERLGATGMFITVVLARLGRSGELVVANAGHPPPLVVSPGGQVSQLAVGGLPLGVLAGVETPVERREVPCGATVVLYSDGLTETASPTGELYGLPRLVQLLERETPRRQACTELVAAVLADLEGFQGNGPREDDLTLVVMRRRT